MKIAYFDEGFFLDDPNLRWGDPAYLLEPESDDGLVAWNFLDAYLETGKTAPVYKLLSKAKIATRKLPAAK